MKTFLLYAIRLFVIMGLLSSCASYKQNIMFKVPEGYELSKATDLAEQNYTIQKNDYLELKVFTNNGERVIDPDLELTKDLQNQNATVKEELHYLVDSKGNVKVPMVGVLHLEGLTIRDAESLLQKEYSTYYTDPFVNLKFTNKRVTVLGAPGGMVVPLENENVRLHEVLALAKGIGNDAKAQNIRVLRGDDVFLVDFSTIDGYKASDLIMQPGDIVYVEPIRKPVSEALRDYSGILSVLVALTTLIVVITSIN